jgi:hypothetical protein
VAGVFLPGRMELCKHGRAALQQLHVGLHLFG